MKVDPGKLDAILARFRDVDGALLSILHAVQGEFGFVPPETVAPIARFLRATPPQIYGILTFYSEFRTRPRGGRVLGICRGPACRLLGALDLQRHVERSLDVQAGETTADDRLSLETVSCLGICGLAPAVEIDHEMAGRVDRQALDQILFALRSGQQEQ